MYPIRNIDLMTQDYALGVPDFKLKPLIKAYQI